MIKDRPAVQDPDLMGRVMVEAVPIQDFTVIKTDMAIKAIRAIRVVTTSKIIRGISNSRVIRVTRSS